MGMFDNLRNFFKGSNNNSVVQEDTYEKSMLASEIVNLVYEIKRINTFDSILWNLNNVSISELERKSSEELKRIHSNLKNRHAELTTQKQTRNITREKLEEAKWTGQKPKGLTDYEFDRLQRDEGR